MDREKLVPLPGWGKAHGHVTLGNSVPVPPGGDADRHLIVERVHRYGWGCDELSREWLEACFTENATWSGSVMGVEPVGPVSGGAEIARWLSSFHPSLTDQRRHLFMNVVVEAQDAERATTVSNILITGAEAGSITLRSSGFYKLELQKVGDAWLIDDLFAGFDAPW